MTGAFPFFIAGCVRSGTTMLREILRQHPRLECPEETHFFRWADPYGTQRYEMVYTKNKLITQQQEMDGFSKDEFIEIYCAAESRRDLMDRYMDRYLDKQDNPEGRWFDKSPQHVYGLPLIKKAYPDAKVIHIYRNPLNVAASLLKGQVMPKQSMIGAVNYWNESMIMMEAYKQLHPEDVLDISYEAFCERPEEHLVRILQFIKEDRSAVKFQLDRVHPERNHYLQAMSDEQRAFVEQQCGEYMRQYGYL